MIKLFNISIKEALQHKKALLFIYFVMVILGGFIGILVKNGMVQGFGSSIELEALSNGFSRTSFFDFLNQNSTFMSSVLNGLMLNFILFGVISIMLNGGLISSMVKREYDFISFLKNSIAIALPFFFIALVTLLIFILWTAALFVPYGFILGNPLTDYTNELPFLYSLLGVGIVYIIGLIYLATFSIVARASFIETRSLSASLGLGFKSIFTFKWKFLSWGILIFLTHLVLLLVYYVSYINSDASSVSILIISFLASQFLVFARVIVKAIAYKGIMVISSNE